jgi:cysteine sulfinate desulfinase/cysteine desulfurase-like protein
VRDRTFSADLEVDADACRGVLFHADAVQAAGLLDLNVDRPGVAAEAVRASSFVNRLAVT